MVTTSNETVTPEGTFERHEMSEQVVLLYRVVRRVLADASDQIVVTAEGATWSRNGQELGAFPFHPAAVPAFPVVVQMILARDPLVAQHIRIDSQDDATLSYRVQ